MSDDDFDLEEDCSEYSDDLDYYHDKGEQDGANDDWSPPHGSFAIDIETRRKRRKYLCENHWYAKGFFHSRGQIDGSNNENNPPSGSHEEYKDIYDEAWEDARENYTEPEQDEEEQNSRE
jgi:hypothetical protein